MEGNCRQSPGHRLRGELQARRPVPPDRPRSPCSGEGLERHLSFPRDLVTFRCKSDGGHGHGIGGVSARRSRSPRFVDFRLMALSGLEARSSWARSSQDQQVVRNDPEPDPALHAVASTIATAGESMTALEHADPALAAGAPPERAPKPSQSRKSTAAQQSDVADVAGDRRAHVALRGEGGIGDGQSGRVAEELDVAVQRGHPQRAIRHARRADLVNR